MTTNCGKIGQEQLPGLDVLKFCMALLVVSIHTHLFKEYEWLSFAFCPGFAVPVFFVVSSYLYFRKPVVNLQTLSHYVRRLAVFYVFWFVLLLPCTIAIQKWRAHFDWVSFSKCLFLGSTFRGSYFIMALMIGVPVVQLLRKCLHPLAALFATFAAHAIFQYHWGMDVLWGSHSFLPFLLWIQVGSLLASVSRWRGETTWARLIALPVLYAGMRVPALLPFARAAFTVALFSVFLDCPITFRPAYVTLRKMSILIFVTHFVFADAVHLLAASRLPALGNSLIQFPVVLGCAALLSWCILKLQTKRFFGWLKYGM